MIVRSALLVAGAGFMAATSPAGAQSASPSSAEGDATKLEEVIVMARRREESLQDVPQTVNVVTSEQIERLDIRNFTDVQSLLPGLTLSGGGSFSTAATVRGVAFNPEASGNNPTVEFYLNDTPIASNFLFQSTFDVGQLELLRGPQGTLRGRAAPSGSITVTTRRPDLSEFGISANATATDTHAYKYDGAINLPIIKEMLALRVAAVSDENEFNRVVTAKRASDPGHNPEPFRDTEAVRASLRFEPTDWLAANFMVQTLDQQNVSYTQVRSASLVTGEPQSGDLVRPYDFRSFEDQGGRGRQEMDIYIWNADVRILGQRLSYSGAVNEQDIASLGTSDAGDYFSPARFALAERSFRDPAGYEAVCQEQGRRVDLVPTNQNYFQCVHTFAKRRSHELRLASEERLFGMFDYVVGAFYDRNDTPSRLTQETPLLAAPTILAAVNLTPIERNGQTTEKSAFGNLTAHIGEALELSGGVRYIEYENFSSIKVNGVNPTPDTTDEDTTSIYTGSVKYRFNPAVMAYATVGTSWRPGVRVIGNFSANLSPRELGFLNLDPEESTSYEAGIKTSFLDERGMFNLSVYQQDFDDYVYRGSSVFYVNYRRLAATVVVPEVASLNYVAGVPVTVKGIEAETSFQILPRWNLSGNVSYADGKIKNGTIACTDLDGDGVPDTGGVTPTLAQLQTAVGPGQNVSQCQFSGRSTFAPEWSANLQTEASMELTPRMDGFVRGLATYTPSNSQDSSNAFDSVESYAMVNLYAGLRDPDGQWEVSLFAKNIFDEQVVLNSGAGPLTTNLSTLRFGPGGAVIGSTSSAFAAPYYSVNVLPEREVGLSLRVGFGSR